MESPQVPVDPLAPLIDPFGDTLPTCHRPGSRLVDVVERGTLRVGLPNDTTSYFLWRGQVLGYEYELLERFADDMGLELIPYRIQSVSDRHLALRRGDVDLVAGRLAALDWPGVVYSEPITEGSPVVLQDRDTSGASDACTLLAVDEPDDLDHMPTYVAANHGWEEAFDDTGTPDPFLVPLRDSATAEAAARRVASTGTPAIVRDDIGGLVSAADEDVIDWPVVDDITVSTHVAFSTEADDLRLAFDDWLLDELDVLEFLQQRYFEDREAHRERVGEPTFTHTTGRLSEYDELFEANARGWLDDHLLASLAYQESRFRPHARSWAGARGLMQIMPRTARQLRVTNPYDPEQAVDGAARYLIWLDDWWKPRVSDPELRLRLVLASYNAGMGHVADARRVAKARGGDPNDWQDIEAALLHLESPRWYQSKHARYGYVRGSEPVAYVREILSRRVRYASLADAGETGDLGD